MNRGYPFRTLATSSLAVILVVALAACGPAGGSPGASIGPAAPSTTPSPSASASGSGQGAAVGGGAPSASVGPSATPNVDVATAFVKILTNGTFKAKATLTGDMTVGSATYPITGTAASNGPDSQQTMTIAIPGAPQTTDTVKVSGVSYSHRGNLWFEEAPTKQGSDFSSAIRSFLDVKDVGVEVRDGQSLHHLVPRGSATVPISSIGVKDPAGDGRVGTEFYARDDGTPVVMAITATMTQVSGTVRQPVTMHLTYTYSSVGGSVIIAVPGQVWATFTSKRYGYSIAYPIDWETHQSGGKEKPDELLSADVAGVYVYRYPTDGYSLNRLTAGYVNELKRTEKAKVAANKATKVAGVPARRLEWSATYKGTRDWVIEVVVVRGKYIYFIEYSSLDKTTDRDRALFDDFLSTVTLPPAGGATSAGPAQAG